MNQKANLQSIGSSELAQYQRSLSEWGASFYDADLVHWTQWLAAWDTWSLQIDRYQGAGIGFEVEELGAWPSSFGGTQPEMGEEANLFATPLSPSPFQPLSKTDAEPPINLPTLLDDKSTQEGEQELLINGPERPADVTMPKSAKPSPRKWVTNGSLDSFASRVQGVNPSELFSPTDTEDIPIQNAVPKAVFPEGSSPTVPPPPKITKKVDPWPETFIPSPSQKQEANQEEDDALPMQHLLPPAAPIQQESAYGATEVTKNWQDNLSPSTAPKTSKQTNNFTTETLHNKPASRNTNPPVGANSTEEVQEENEPIPFGTNLPSGPPTVAGPPLREQGGLQENFVAAFAAYDPLMTSEWMEELTEHIRREFKRFYGE